MIQAELREVGQVLCCHDCQNRLSEIRKIVQTSEGSKDLGHGGFFCINCNYTPSMQDTYIQLICPDCKCPVQKKDLLFECPQCQQVLVDPYRIKK